jgi:localization factor PodJL
MSLGEWLNTIIIQQAEEEGVQAPSIDDDEDGDEISTVHQRLDEITRRIEKLGRSGPEAYAPKRSRQEPDQLAELIGRLDRRLDQFANVSPPPPPPMMPPAMPSTRLPPSLDRAVAEISARQRMLNGNGAPPSARMPAPEPRLQTQGALALAAPPVMAAPVSVPAPAPMPLPVQDLSGLEDQLRNITNQIETLRKPGVEQAINALRDELGEIGRTLNDAMPRRAIDAIEKQIQGLNQRIAEGRQAGIDTGALGGIEHGLAEVRDALRELTPAESLIGFNDAVAGLAHKIDLIVAQKDPATLAQLESAITTLREMSTHIASNETVRSLASQVQELGEKVEQMAHAGNFGEALNHLEHRIGSLSDALEASAQSGGAVPPRLEALVGSLSDKIEQIQNSRGNSDAFGHLEDRIVNLVEKLDASDSRLGYLEALERGLADLLMHVEANKDSGPRADPSPGVNDLKNDIARTQDALEAVHGTLGHVVDRLAMIEKDIRGDARPRAAAESEMPLAQPAGRVAVRAVESPPLAAAMPEPSPPPPPPPPAAAAPPPPAPRRMPQAAQLPIDPDLPPDQPLEPGSGPPQLRANPAARIAASEAALGGSRPAAVPGGQSGFIAAARRAAQAAVQEPSNRAPRAEALDAYEPETPSLRGKLMKRVKSLFVAASIIAIVIGSIQIAGNILNSDKSGTQTAQAPATNTDKIETAASSAAQEPTASIPVNPLALPKLPAMPPLAMPSGNTPIATVPPYGFATPTMPSLFSPPMLGTHNDVTGSISRPTNSPPVSPKQPNVQMADRLPSGIGGAHLRSAAVAGDATAAYEIGVRFAEGHGVPANLEEAARWYERAASKGLVPAQFRYASLLEKGQGVKKDLAQARRLYLAAATKGNGKAMHNLAVLYAEGIDGKPDYSTAVQWFRKASQRGIADSQYNLGVLCARGLGTPKNYPEAYKWFALAADQGDKESARKRDDLATHMDPAALATAQNEVKNFVAEPQPEQATVVPEPPGGWDHAPGAPPRARAQPTGPLALGSFQVGKR